MSEANEGGPTVVVVAPSAEAPGGSGESGEVATTPEVGETLAEAAVEIAHTEAERDCEIARIEAETERHEHEQETAQAEAVAEAISNAELEQCRLRIAELEGENTALRTELNQLTPPPSEEPPPSPPPLESDAEVGPKENLAEVEAEAPEPEKPRRKPLRWI